MANQTLGPTPLKKHRAWQYTATPSTKAGEAAEIRKYNAQSVRNARKKKARGAEEPEEPEEAPPPRDSLAVRALRLGIGQGEPLGFGPERHKAQKALSKEVSRAEQSLAERDALNERRRDLRAAEQPEERDARTERRRDQRAPEQLSVDARDALNARRRANEQVTISVRLHCALLHTTPVRLGVSNIPY